MKFIILAIIIALVSTHNIPGYIHSHSSNGSIKPQADQDSYTEQSFVNLLKNNFQVLGNSNVDKQLIEEFGKGNLFNPVQLNYLFLIEGEDQSELHNDNARINVEINDSQQKIVDQIFNPATESIFRLVQEYFPNEARSPFYYYQSQQLNSESMYNKVFGVELIRDASNNNLFFFDNQTKQQIGKQFDLNQCFEQNYPEFRIQRDQIVKQNSSLKLEINEQNAKQVDSLLKDLCAVSKLSAMFKKSEQPNFIVFALNYEELSKNALVQDLLKSMFKKASTNFAKSIGQEQVFGEVLYVSEIDMVEQEKAGNMTPRILAQEGESEGGKTAQLDGQNTIKQIKAWFSIGFALVLLGILYGLFYMDIQKDTLLYAKFLVTEGVQGR